MFRSRILHPGERTIVFTLGTLVFAAASELMIVAPILKNIGVELNIPEDLWGTLLTAYAVCYGIFAFIIGPVSDRVGRRKILLWGATTLSISSFFNGLASDYATMLLFRALAGIAAGVLSGAAVSYVGDYFPYERRGAISGMVMVGAFAGSLVGIPAGSYLTALFNFRAPFFLFALVAATAAVFIATKLPTPQVKLSDSRLTARRYVHQYMELLRQPNVIYAALIHVLMFMSFALFVTYMPTWLMATFGVDERAIASLYFVGGIASIISAPLAGRVSDRIGRKPLIILANFGLAGVMLVTPILDARLVYYYPHFFLLMVMVSSRAAPFQAMMTAFVPSRQRGTLFSLCLSVGQLGMGLGGAVSGTLYSRYGFHWNTASAALATFLVVLIIAFLIKEPSASSARAKG